MQTGKKIAIILLVILLIAALAAGGYFVLQAVDVKNAPAPEISGAEYADSIFNSMKNEEESSLLWEYGTSDGRKLVPDKLPETEEGKLLYNYCFEGLGYEMGEISRDKRDAVQKISLSFPVLDDFSEGLNEKLNEKLAIKAKEAKKPSDIYTENKEFKPEIVEELYSELFNEKLNEEKICETSLFSMELNYRKGIWHLMNKEEVREGFLSWVNELDFDSEAERIKSDALAELSYIPITYKIEETALRGPAPDQNRFIVTTEPEEISALLDSEEAKLLLGDKKLLWNPDVPAIPGRNMYCYLDESILAISWQQVEAQAVGTYSEVVVADGSQLRRRIAGDEYENFNHKTTTEFAIDCNGVVTMGGDFYHHSRSCGIIVYDREVKRFDPYTCDTCYITADGDMLFSYRNQFSSWEEAQNFVDENDILFSLAFGPVLIDDYNDVTPEEYPWGEIKDHYARSGLGMFEDNHYLGININCEQPDYYYLVTLRDLADAMLRAGCSKAYTLDGGQTATTVFNQTLINPVQFGWEKPISDVIYFATAIPNE